MPPDQTAGVWSTNPKLPCRRNAIVSVCRQLKARSLIRLPLMTAGLVLAGCQSTPTSYEQWKQEQAERARFAAAGVPYKSPSELRAEAAEMRRISEDVSFKPGK